MKVQKALVKIYSISFTIDAQKFHLEKVHILNWKIQYKIESQIYFY